MNLHVVIPGLNWPDTSQHQLYHNLSLPSLEKLLSKSNKQHTQPQEIEAWLCKTFSVTKQQDWPVAPIMCHSDSAELIKTDKDYWIHADPVHLRIEQNHLMLADSQAFQITDDEAEGFTNDINQILSKDNWTLQPLHSKRWYIRTTKTPKMSTYALSQVTCKNINNFLPSGEDSGTWHKKFNEIQMLLHEHPINKAREGRGELAINSIWFWGGGHHPQSIKSPYTKIWCNNEITRALSLASGTEHGQLPLDATSWQQHKISGNHLLMLDILHGKAQYRDAYSWRENLLELEKNWFAPLYAALKQGDINMLTITALNETGTWDFSITRTNLWKFWLPRKPLLAYATNH
ncbi:MAG: phosphoglycerate mutase [Betaproteobacteria bacterium]|nr:phosphoglycerate mutase [Betaproteobacteria bacterium]